MVPADFVLGETTMDQVAAQWGLPDEEWTDDQYRIWSYENVVPGGVQMRFRAEKVVRISFAPQDCTLGDLVSIWGPPEVVRSSYWEEPTTTPRMGPPIIPLKIMHYPRLGLMFYVKVDRPEGLTHHLTTDIVGGRIVYPPTTLEALLSSGPANWLNWTGFDE